jgi:Tol biopolymer transport system component
MATVFLAHDLRHERDVAIKVLHPDLGAALGAERFLSEIKTTAKLQHPHILPLLDSGAADGLLYYVMPYVRGETLRARLERETQLPLADTLRTATEVAEALHVAHAAGIVHRDIKPENILLQDGHALVADFGIAVAVQHAGGQRMTQTGLSLGTPQYMSPEQASGEKGVDARSDVYALAAVTYEMLTGSPPFTGASVQAIMARVMTSDPEPPSRVRKTVPPAVEAAVLQGLAKLPADRMASARAFAELLDGERAATSVRTAPAAMRGPATRGPAAVLAVVALIATVAAIAGWLRGTNREPPPGRRLAIDLPEEQPLVSDPGRLALSPDGRTLAYLGQVKGQVMVLLRALDSTEAVPLAGTEGADNVAFSPDGGQVAFTAGAPRGLRVIPVTGGVSRLLTDSLVDIGGLAWGEDGYLYLDGDLDGNGIARVREQGGAPEIVTRINAAAGQRWHLDPFALPDGRGVLFQLATRDGPQIGVIDLRTRTVRSLGPGIRPQYRRSGHLLWCTADGLLMAAPFSLKTLDRTGETVVLARGVNVGYLDRSDVALSASGLVVYLQGVATSGRESFALLDRRGTVLRSDSAGAGSVYTYNLSKDGTRLAWDLMLGTERQVWTRAIDGGRAIRFSYTGANNSAPFWLPDGDLAFVNGADQSSRGVTLYRGTPGGASPVQWRTIVGPSRFVVSPDGRWLLPWGGRIQITAASGDTAVRTLVDKPAATELLPEISPDNRWMAYESDESGRPEVYVRSFPDAERVVMQVSTDGGMQPAFSGNGRELFYVNVRNELVTVPVTTGDRFTIGTPERLFDLTAFGATRRRWYVPLPDGRRFITLRPLTTGSQPLRLVLLEGLESLMQAPRRP